MKSIRPSIVIAGFLSVILAGCYYGPSKMPSPRPDDGLPTAKYIHTRVASIDMYRVMYSDGSQCLMTFGKGQSLPTTQCEWATHGLVASR